MLSILSRKGAWSVKSRKHEEEMRLFLSVRDGSDTNKVHLQTSDLRARPGVEIYFDFDLRTPSEKKQDTK